MASFYTRSKIGLQVFGNLSSKIVHKAPPIQESAGSRIYRNWFPNRVKFSSYSPINSQRVDFSVSINRSPIFSTTKRHYYVPYTKRNCDLVYVSTALEKMAGDKFFEDLKENKYKDMILPETNPDNVRVRLIFRDIIGVFQRGPLGLKRELEGRANEGIQIDQQQSNGKDEQEEELQASITHLSNLNWEVLVVNDPDFDAAGSLLGGKVVVSTNVLKHFESDAELAIIIGHEVGHVVARHPAEKLEELLLLNRLQLLMKSNIVTRLLCRLLNLLNDWCCRSRSRKNELEADYIGMMLAASAGYDPRIAPKVYRHGWFRGRLIELFATHPRGYKRSQSLAEAQVMEEALTLYQEKIKVSAN